MTSTTAPLPPLDVMVADLASVNSTFARAFVAKVRSGAPLSEIMLMNGFRAWTAAGFQYVAPVVASIRPNKYPGTCDLCGEVVLGGAGQLMGRNAAGHFDVRHVGLCPKTPEMILADLLGNLEVDRRFALRCIDDRNDLDFVFVTVGRNDVRSIKRFVGGGSHKVEVVERQIAWATMLAGMSEDEMEAAGALFAEELHRCTDCGLPLEKLDSRMQSRGPKCAQKRREMLGER